MKHRKLRITYSAICGILCLLLVTLWVRSFWHDDIFAYSFGAVTCAATSLRGCVTLYCGQMVGANFNGYITMPASISQLAPDIPGTYFWFRLTKLPTETSLLLPMWFVLATVLGIATIPWVRWRFSLRTLLVATTVFAVVLGAIIYAAR